MQRVRMCWVHKSNVCREERFTFYREILKLVVLFELCGGLLVLRQRLFTVLGVANYGFGRRAASLCCAGHVCGLACVYGAVVTGLRSWLLGLG